MQKLLKAIDTYPELTSILGRHAINEEFGSNFLARGELPFYLADPATGKVVVQGSTPVGFFDTQRIIRGNLGLDPGVAKPSRSIMSATQVADILGIGKNSTWERYSCRTC
jgi:hypothetical protein